jgi:hypothetical protein
MYEDEGVIIDQPLLSKDVFVSSPSDSHVTMIRSPMGTGKTLALIEYIKTLPLDATVVIVSFRMTFTSDILSKLDGLNFEDYRDVKKTLTGHEQFNLTQHPRVVIQYESLITLSCRKQEGNRCVPCMPDVVICDEIESICAQVDHYNHNKTAIAGRRFGVLSGIVRYGKKVIFMDAFLGHRAYSLAHLSHRSTFTITNVTKPWTDRRFIMTSPDLLASLIQRESNERIAIVSNSKKYLESMRMILRDNGGENKVIKLYTSEEGDRKDFDDVNAKWSDADVLMYSPTCMAGVSYQQDTFKYLFCHFTTNSCDVRSCFQMMGRIREIQSKQTFVAIGSNYESHLPDTEEEMTRALEDYHTTPGLTVTRTFVPEDLELFKADETCPIPGLSTLEIEEEVEVEKCSMSVYNSISEASATEMEMAPDGTLVPLELTPFQKLRMLNLIENNASRNDFHWRFVDLITIQGGVIEVDDSEPGEYISISSVKDQHMAERADLIASVTPVSREVRNEYLKTDEMKGVEKGKERLTLAVTGTAHCYGLTVKAWKQVTDHTTPMDFPGRKGLIPSVYYERPDVKDRYHRLKHFTKGDAKMEQKVKGLVDKVAKKVDPVKSFTTAQHHATCMTYEDLSTLVPEFKDSPNPFTFERTVRINHDALWEVQQKCAELFSRNRANLKAEKLTCSLPNKTELDTRALLTFINGNSIKYLGMTATMEKVPKGVTNRTITIAPVSDFVMCKSTHHLVPALASLE